PSMPEGATSATMFTNIAPNNNGFNTVNLKTNFGKEYVWHCHLLGHEENDMMRPIVFQVAPEAPSSLLATVDASNNGVLTWTDNSATETGFVVERDTDPTFPAPALLNASPSVALNALSQGIDNGSTITLTDTTLNSVSCAVQPCTVYYRVRALNSVALQNAWAIPQISQTLYSAYSNVAQLGVAPAISVSPNPSLAFGNQLVGTVSAAQTVTVTNNGAGTLVVSGVTITGANPTDFVQTNTCSAPISNAGTCTISVTFNPSLSGARAATLTINSNDPNSPTKTVALTGTGITPVMVVTPATVSFGNQPVNTTSAPAVLVTISNTTGTAALTINNIALSGANAGDFAQTNTCGAFPATIAVGSSCTVSLTFTPSAVGARSGLLDVTVAAPANSQSVALSGTGTVPAVTLSPTSLAFGSQLVTAPATAGATQSVTLTNSGLAPLAITSIALGGANPGDFVQTNTCSASLGAGLNCSISVKFAPTARGARSASVVITDSASGSPQSFAVSGTGIAPVASLSLTPINFGVQVLKTTSAPQSVTLLNNGDAPLSISSILVSGDFARVTNTSNCGTSLAPLANCTISVTFTPTVVGLRTGAIAIGSSDPFNPTLTVPLSGMGTALSLNPQSLTLRDTLLGTGTSFSVTLTNVGTTTLNVSSITFGGANPGDFTKNNGCIGNLPPARSCTVSGRFIPTAVGTRSTLLIFNTNDPVNPQSVPITGNGVAPVLALSPASLTFASPLNVRSTAQTVTVSNTGTAPLTINGISLGGLNANQFTMTTNCQTGTNRALAVGSSCTVNVTFYPRAATPTTKSAVLNVSVATPAKSQSVTLTGTVQ
ncbi:MAG TPA: choice-of-anchor D domain-containing protein, partial [Terriglobales bacterium]